MRSILVVLLISFALAASAVRPNARKISGKSVPKIVGGDFAVRGQFPYQVSVQWGLLGIWQHVCGGTIISPTWVLSAGHCVTEVPGGDLKIIAGILNLDDANVERQEINIIQRVVNPDFAGGVGPNDVSLFQLESALVWNEVVQPISLPESGLEVTGTATLSGWGAINDVIIPIMPNELHTVDIPILTQEECNTAVNSLLVEGEVSPYSNASNICTGPLTGGISACSGDSGGPLAQNSAIVGIVSWGWTPCGSEGAPSVFTKTSNFIDFITATVTDLPKRV